MTLIKYKNPTEYSFYKWIKRYPSSKHWIERIEKYPDLKLCPLTGTNEFYKFVKTTIVSILSAVKKSGEELKLENEIFVGTKGDKRSIEFDIAVSVEESKIKEGGAKIKVLEFVEGGGLFHKRVKNSTVSRIRFGVYTPRPYKKD